MSKAKDAAFYRSIRDHFLKLVEYVIVLERDTMDLSDEFCCIKENMRHIEHQLSAHLNFKQLTEFLRKREKNDRNN